MLAKIEAMIKEAERQYQSAAGMHFQSKCSYYGGQIDALRAVLKELETSNQ